MYFNEVIIILLFSLIGTISLTKYLGGTKKKSLLTNEFATIFMLLNIHLIGIILQILFSRTNIKPIYFDYITYISGVYLPIALLALALTYYNSKFNIKNIIIFLIIPTISLLVLWTNDFHNLFYKVYSVNYSDTVYGVFFIIHSVYSYLILFISFIILITASIRNSGFFSKQTALIVLGCIIPILVNILGTAKIVSMSIYVTPMLFIFSSICFALAIIKFKALSITPVAFRTVINTMSDAFVVISSDGTIAEKNDTFDRKLGKILNVNKEENLFTSIENKKILDIEDLKNHINETKNSNGIITQEYHIVSGNIDKYFEVDIHPIKAKHSSEYIGTLLLFKDITQHKIDIKTIEDKQEVIVKQGQLVSIGELAGGMAHDINTPISGIKAGLQMLEEMNTTKTDVEKELFFRMNNCADKIIKIVNSMRNQIRNLGSNEKCNFKISSVIEDIRVIAFNEIQKNKCELVIKIIDDVEVYGDPTKLRTSTYKFDC
jgi:two-component system, NtrC family, sensor histidine kinase HupT/HoxJ